jgi:hypothetical protein
MVEENLSSEEIPNIKNTYFYITGNIFVLMKRLNIDW